MDLVSRNNRPRILFDMDDVITNTLHSFMKIYNEENNSNYTVDDIREWDLVSKFGEGIFDIFRQQDFFYDLDPKNDAVAVLTELINSTKYDVFIITACNSVDELAQKVRWLQKLIPDFNLNRIISCKEKEIIRGDLIVDDKLANLYACEPFMKCVVYDMPHNRNENRFDRITKMSDILPILEETFKNID